MSPQTPTLPEGVQIVPYTPQYKDAFKALNEEWISTYFTLEEADKKALDHPQENIIEKGGHIFVALWNAAPVGVCALLKSKNASYDYELAKMAVSPRAQGRRIGWLLGTAAIQAAKDLGATRIYLESNTILTPAINLYRKLGFRELPCRPTPYQRCNIQMELLLSPGA